MLCWCTVEGKRFSLHGCFIDKYVAVFKYDHRYIQILFSPAVSHRDDVGTQPQEERTERHFSCGVTHILVAVTRIERKDALTTHTPTHTHTCANKVWRRTVKAW